MGIRQTDPSLPSVSFEAAHALRPSSRADRPGCVFIDWAPLSFPLAFLPCLNFRTKADSFHRNSPAPLLFVPPRCSVLPLPLLIQPIALLIRYRLDWHHFPSIHVGFGDAWWGCHAKIAWYEAKIDGPIAPLPFLAVWQQPSRSSAWSASNSLAN